MIRDSKRAMMQFFCVVSCGSQVAKRRSSRRSKQLILHCLCRHASKNIAHEFAHKCALLRLHAGPPGAGAAENQPPETRGGDAPKHMQLASSTITASVVRRMRKVPMDPIVEQELKWFSYYVLWAASICRMQAIASDQSCLPVALSSRYHPILTPSVSGEECLASPSGGLSEQGEQHLAYDLAVRCQSRDEAWMSLKHYMGHAYNHAMWPNLKQTVGKLLARATTVTLQPWESLCNGFRKCWLCSGSCVTPEHLATDKHRGRILEPASYLSENAPAEVAKSMRSAYPEGGEVPNRGTYFDSVGHVFAG